MRGRRLDGDDGAVPRAVPAGLSGARAQVEAVDVVPEGEVAGQRGDPGDEDGGLVVAMGDAGEVVVGERERERKRERERGREVKRK